MKTNRKVKAPPVYTHEGAKATRVSDALTLRRTVMTCMLWEDQFYESGKDIAARIKELTLAVHPEDAVAVAIDARELYKLRHAPLWIARWLASGNADQRKACEYVLPLIIQRPDEITEFMALYWKSGKTPIAACVKRGLSAAFNNFSEYQLAKYNRADGIKLKDVLFLVHQKPAVTEVADRGVPALEKKGYQRGHVFRHSDHVLTKLVEDRLETPDTWEVQLSAGKDKLETWTRLLEENKLGALALLRNLRNMQEAKVSTTLIRAALAKCNTERVLPFRFITAAKYAPKLEDALEATMFRALAERPKLQGKTVVLIDVSGSMMGPISAKSEASRLDTAAALAMLLRELCEEPVIYLTAGNDHSMVHRTELVPARRGFALRDVVQKSVYSLGGGGIFLKQACKFALDKEGAADRLIVLTDEQDCDHKANPADAPAFGKQNYLINVASYKNGIGYGKWTHIDGWSEAVLDFIQAFETVQQ